MAQRRRRNAQPPVTPAQKTAAIAGTTREHTLALWQAALVIAIVTFAVYYPSLNAPFIFDDSNKIVENPDIKDPGTILQKLVYPYKPQDTLKRNDPSRPVVYLSFALNYLAGRLNPVGYHVTNTALHCVNVFLLFVFLRRVQRKLFNSGDALFPLASALVFAVHPLSTSTVSYIFSRSDILALGTYLGAVLFFWTAAERARPAPALLGALALFVVSLYSKQLAATLPAVLLVLHLVVLSNYDLHGVLKGWKLHAPFWVVLGLYLLWRAMYFGGLGDLEARTAYPAQLYLSSQAFAWIRYFQMMLVPAGLSIDHGVMPDKTSFSVTTLLSWIAVLATLAGIAVAALRRTPEARLIAFCGAWFVIVILPTSSILPTSAVVVENRVYLPAVGWVPMLVLGWFVLFRRKLSGDWHRPLVIGLAAYVTVLAGTSYARNLLYRDPLVLWNDVVTTYPENPRAHVVLGGLYQEKKQYGDALRHFETALRLNPGRPGVNNNMASIYYTQKDAPKAIEHYLIEVQASPKEAAVHKNLANVYYSQKMLDNAVSEYTKALALQPDYPDAAFELGTLVLTELKDYPKAVQYFRQSLTAKPDQPSAQNNLGYAYFQMKDFQNAEAAYLKALALDPGFKNAQTNLDNLYRATGRKPGQ